MSDTSGYGVPELMQLFMQSYGGSLADQGKASTIDARKTNIMQDLFQMMMSPEFAAMTGTYDPTLLGNADKVVAQPTLTEFNESTPQTDGVMKAGTSFMCEIASGMKSGDVSPDSARTLLDNAYHDHPELFGDRAPEDYYKQVDDLYGEVTSNQALRGQAAAKNQQTVTEYERTSGKAWDENYTAPPPPRTDPFVKMGLPSPTEQYTADTLPRSQNDANRSAMIRKALEMQQGKMDAYDAQHGGEITKRAPSKREDVAGVTSRKWVGPPQTDDTGQGNNPKTDHPLGDTYFDEHQARVVADEYDSLGNPRKPIDYNNMPDVSYHGGKDRPAAAPATDKGHWEDTSTPATTRYASKADFDNAAFQYEDAQGRGVTAEQRKKAFVDRQKVSSKTRASEETAIQDQWARQGQADRASARGRTPLQDALMARLAMMRQVGAI